jgi:hypothetical protein
LEKDRMRAACPHPDPRQLLHALLYLAYPCARLPEGDEPFSLREKGGDEGRVQ